MENSTTQSIEVIIEILCGTAVIGLISFITFGQKLAPIFERLLG